jgi:hypothetical protein
MATNTTTAEDSLAELGTHLRLNEHRHALGIHL